jgi:hypothetical protein
VAHGRADPPAIEAPAQPALAVGRVQSAGTWTDAHVRTALADLLGTPLAAALRPAFEWYLCRGAFFHNDAHYDGVLFGVWCVCGPPADLVFPRARLRLDASPGCAAVFDPFEIHGVLAPGRLRYAAEDYDRAAPSVFIGFELTLDEAVARAFRVPPTADGRTVSSATRIDAVTGAFD